MQAALQDTEASLGRSNQRLAATQQQLATLERSHKALLKLWASNKRHAEAARTIQRHYKAWRLRTLRDQSHKSAHVRPLAPLCQAACPCGPVTLCNRILGQQADPVVHRRVLQANPVVHRRI